ncbi:MAG TPA: plasmid mobilization relaxosome protein MobC [Xanthobacteraceae bacterium]
MARPRKSEPRDRQLNLSLTAAELAGIERRADALGMRPVHFGRALLLDDGHKLSIARGPENNAPRLILSQLSRLGNNLNQVVRHLHRTGDPLPPDLEPLLNDIRHIIARVEP